MAKVMTAKQKHDENRPVRIDLGREEGNVFILMGIAQKILETNDRDPDIFMQMMKSSDYKHAVGIFLQIVDGYNIEVVLPEGCESLEDLS